jgi:segregation and condensation protein B
MGTDALTEYQQLGERLEQAAESLGGSRKRVRRKNPLQGQSITGSPDHPAEPLPERAATEVPEVAAGGGVAEADDVALAAAPDGEVVAESAGGVDEDGGEPGAEKTKKKTAALVNLAALEALLFTTRHPLTPSRVAELIDVPSSKALRQAIAELNGQYESAGRSFRIEQVAGGYQMLTLPEFGPLLQKLHQRDIDSKLTRSALETLSIIAYKQPVLRAEVEAIRGVASGETIRSLMEKHLVKIAGRAEEPGRPILYGTTKRFLELFGLNSLKELPKDGAAKVEDSPPAGVPA